MIEIRKLMKYTMENEKSFGLHGFTTKKIYEVEKKEKYDQIEFLVRLLELGKPLTKIWPYIEEDISWYNKIISQELSFGAYDENKLVGVIIVDEVKWNNSFSIANLLVSDKYRGKGVGSLLIDKITCIAKKKGVRVLSLETQSTNVPAITFYMKNGFVLDALDLSLYTNEDIKKNEIAFFMKKKL
ncbi:acetyltransferase (GNAT) family protein [Natranaerovirga pectinivora]|uniref:Acetyltransferase (GNAT) family protein n=1 Tax=Natranaerovirga pectinivora TaxID=682400 RepID=A0A4R3MLQ9_9FIRM|nr:GNAT family N-acetyltransferase [Natranaerovirga pectinivora]TCT15642.1 acetyltransferase (GNAT) family protein [Natranaerovirga pectinivora]